MSVKDTASAIFKFTDWTGGSDIHVSVARIRQIKHKYKDSKYNDAIYQAAKEMHAGLQFWQYLQKNFSHFEWLLDAETFEKLFLVDLYRSLHLKKPSQSKEKFQNPATKNWFHRIAVHPQFIGGIRFWGRDPVEEFGLAFRFRIVKPSSLKEEEEVRKERLQENQTVLTEFKEIEGLMDIAEPLKQRERREQAKEIESCISL